MRKGMQMKQEKVKAFSLKSYRKYRGQIRYRLTGVIMTILSTSEGAIDIAMGTNFFLFSISRLVGLGMRRSNPPRDMLHLPRFPSSNSTFSSVPFFFSQSFRHKPINSLGKFSLSPDTNQSM